MSLSLLDQLKIAEQGYEQDVARLKTLEAERDAATAIGADTSVLDQQIASLQQDIDAGETDMIELQSQINDQNAAVEETPPPEANSELEEGEEISEDEEQQLETAELEEETEPDDAAEQEEETADEEDAVNSTGDTGAAGTSTGTTTKSLTGTGTAPAPKPVMNPLHGYATSTYGLTLFVLTKDNYNELVTGPTVEGWNPKYCLISSAGAYKDIRHPYFQDDFYFDNFKMQSVIGMNNNTRGGNAIEFSFTIIEPYGLTLLDRLVDLCNSPEIGNGNYTGQPYLLQIDFFGSNDLGDIESPIPELRKRLPIQFIEFKIKVGKQGTEYAVKAIPYNHNAFKESTNSTPANFEIKADTVGNFFTALKQDNMAAQIAAKDQARSDAILARGIVVDDDGNPLVPEGQIGLGGDKNALEAATSKINAPYSVSSYAGAWNAWQQVVADQGKVEVANEIDFVIDDEIANSPIVDPKKMSYSRTDMPAPGTATNKAAAQGNNADVSKKTPGSAFDTSKMLFNISSGTSVVDVINLVLKNSDYIKKQVQDPLTDKVNFKEEAEVSYFKVIPQVILKEFDTRRGEYAKKTIYHIKKYKYFNTKHPNLPKSKPKGPVKKYDYIYTGKNIDILDFGIDFDAAFFTPITTNREKAEALSGAPAADSGDPGKDKTGKPVGTRTVAPNVHKPQSADASATATGSDTAKTVLVADAMKSIYSSSRGDMINVKLKILGDPHFIKQDDCYIGPHQHAFDADQMMLNEGTLNTDSGEIFCKINFKTPVDMDDATGLMRENTRYRTAKFSGFYRILMVDSEFSKGQFVQTLELIRIFDDGTETGEDKAKAAATRGLRAETEKEIASADQSEARDLQDDPAGTDDEDEASDADQDNVDNQEDTEEEEFDTNEYEIPDDYEPEDTTALEEGDAIANDVADAEEVDAGDWYS